MSPFSDLELNAIGVLKRRAIEARIVAPLLRAFAAEIGEARAHAIARSVIGGIAREQGAALAKAAGGDSLEQFEGTLEHWTADDALRIAPLAADAERLDFDVVRCRYAEMYRDLGVPELGPILSCERDAALIEGFNAGVSLDRAQTIMQGDSCCTFRYSLRRAVAAE